jgi:transcription termination/antitermination protein NusG
VLCEGKTILTDQWYAVSTRSRQEKTAASAIEHLGIQAFVPLVTEVRRWSDRKKAITVPLFPSYFFVRIPVSRDWQVRVLKTPGVVGLVGGPAGPLAIPEKEIDDIRSVLSKKLDCSPYPFLNLGERVRIVGGALNGVEGTLVGRGPDAKLVISIELIQRSLAVSVYGFEVTSVRDRSHIAA